MTAAKPQDATFKTVFFAGLIILAIAAVFGQATGFDFLIYDDDTHITRNPYRPLWDSFEGVKWAFTDTLSGNWHPLVSLSFILDYKIFALQPFGYHLTNLILFGLFCILVFLALNQISQKRWLSFFAVLLYAVHPMRVPAAIWISGRKDVLSGLFMILAIWAYGAYVSQNARGAEGRSRERLCYALAILLFAFALMAKATLVVLPFLFLVMDYWPLKRFEGHNLRKLLMEKVPFLILSLGPLIMAFIAIGNTEHLYSDASLGLFLRLKLAAVNCAIYLLKFLYPSPLNFFYPMPESISLLLAVGAVALLLGLICLGVRCRRNNPYVLTGIFWFLISLFPVLGIVAFSAASYADRYSFIPHLGVSVLIVWGVHDLMQRLKSGQKVVRYLTIIIGMSFILSNAMTAHSYGGHWRTSESLFEYGISATDDNYYAFNNLGIIYARRGEFKESIPLFQKAIELNPNFSKTYRHLGVSYMKSGESKLALKYLKMAKQKMPKDRLTLKAMAELSASSGRR